MKEEEIRPHKLFDEYLRLAEQDARTFFSDMPRSGIPCPGCEGEGKKVFSKNGFDFQECPDCLTLFVNPRPPMPFQNITGNLSLRDSGRPVSIRIPRRHAGESFGSVRRV